MRKEINGEIKINGQKMLVKQVKKWQYNNENDNPFVSKLNENRWKAFLSVKKGWNTLDTGEFLPKLDKNFEYGSYWVHEPNLKLDNYKNYIVGKFDTIKKTSSQPEITVVVLREGISPVNYTYALFLHQKTESSINESLLVFDFNEDKISNLYMIDPDVYSFESYRIGIIDTNSEPKMFKHFASKERIGQIMTDKELLTFGIEITKSILNESGKKVVSVNTANDESFPDIIYEDKGIQYYVKLIPFLPPENDINISYGERFTFSCFATVQNAYAVALPIGFYCMDTFGANPISGSTFAIKFNSAIFC
ncbi:hypothetical protein TREPR_2173 [Treponema primitia ZAS-2]|uniref:Uncharacterized protein n=1 Tax=Treponema primitia (strain ATCC BAA-887 / DSM 12427 / ZAS-2) TaxID=545694 RepID=F5YJ29_TREPZ|nr:hypothetical protein [Treponema primitia]AEF85254.1 hypothetical protein TREPR_2173 [Treponema primitia ZAS-2]